MKAKVLFYFSILFLFANRSFVHAQTVKILFDATKAEMAGNADWVIDANTHNLGFTNGPAVVGQGTESNPSQIPSPAQSGITSTTAETYWNGGLSYWAIDCVNRNYIVESLPYNGQITYGNSGNPQDLSNYDVYIVCEPNILFTASEKTAILAFVQNGGGLFMVSDHANSDRNNDGWDSPQIWNDLMSNNGIQSNPFGMTFDMVDFSQTTTNIPSLPNDSILHGPAGNVTSAQWTNGTSLTLNTTQNSTVKGVVYKNGSSFGNSNVMCAYARYGNGKVAAIGDSSPCDDGTGDSNDQLYNGYIVDAGGNHRKLLMNITIWLATQSASSVPVADFTASALSPCIGQATTFTNASSSGVTSYSWNFGSGATPATANTVGPHSVSYSTSGSKTVSLTVTSPGGTNTATKTNYITVPSVCPNADLGVLSLLNPSGNVCPTNAQQLQVRVKNYGSSAVNFSSNNMDVIIAITDPSSVVQSFTKTINSGTLAAGSTLDVTFSNTYDMSTPGNYTFNSNTVFALDGNSSNDAMAPVVITVNPGFQSNYTVVSENMGTVSTTTTITQHETNNGFQNVNLTMSGTADVRITLPSSGYPSASGGANVFFTNTVGKNFIIEGINTIGFSDLQLSFGITKSVSGSTGSDFLIKVSTDGVNYTSLTLPSLPSGTSWGYVTVSGNIPATANLRIQFIQNGTTTQYRIDDLLLTNLTSLPTITPQGPLTFCQGGSVTLSATSASSYLWSNGSTTQNISVTLSGNYSVVETNSFGCTASAPAVQVTVNPVYNYNVNAAVCPGVSYTLPDGFVVSSAGSYTSTLQTIAGCDSIIVTNLSVISINDNNACTTDACNSTSGLVTHTAVNVDDGNSCTTDACNSTSGTISHTAVNVDDGNPCTTDACNSTSGVITHTSLSVDDGNACTTDACNSSTGVITHTAININDNNACTTDVCNSSSGLVTHTAVNIDDANSCTTDACNSTSGAITHTAVNVDDGNACTTDACNSTNGAITHTAVNVDDGNACTTDACNSTSGAITHTAVNVDDGNACTTDACDSTSGAITHTAVNVDDGNACTTDGCNSTSGAIAHTAVNVDDGNACTTDACNSTSGAITHTALNVDDGNACTTDACNSASGAITHTAVNIDDGNACTTDACNSSSGLVTHTAVIVDDGNPCTTDACNSSNGVITHLDINIDDGNSCTIDACNITSGAITHTAVNVDDGNVCTTDACDSSSGLITHTTVSVDDGNICTTDGCDSVTGIYHTLHPEICNNGIDDNCDGNIDEGCTFTLHIRVLIDGYYFGNNQMVSVIDPSNFPGICDTIVVELRSPVSPYGIDFITQGAVTIDGDGFFAFPPGVSGNDYFISVKQRNTLNTWSASPVHFGSSMTFYSFTDASTKAYGNNLRNLNDGNFALFSGDVNQNGTIDAFDFSEELIQAGNFQTGYLPFDLTGDGLTESSDISILENNIGMISIHP